MKAYFLGAVSAAESSMLFGKVFENLEGEQCQHCLQSFKSGERFAVLKITGMKDIAVHIQCACIWRERMGAGVRASAGGGPEESGAAAAA